MIQESWWEAIPARTDLRYAKFSAMNSEGYALRNREIQTNELTSELFAATYLAALYKSEHQREGKFPESLAFDLNERSRNQQGQTQTAFTVFGLTHQEMELRLKRVRLNLATLKGLESLNSNQLNPGELHHDYSFIQEAQGKFLESLSDDEIAELAAIAESQVIGWIPAHKEILIELFERRGTGLED